MAQLKDLLVMGPGRVIGDAFFGSKLMPTVDAAQDIGSSTVKWNNIYGSLKGNADTASYPLGFTSRSTPINQGTTVGTTLTQWNDSTGGWVGFRRDNPSGGETSMVINGRVYVAGGLKPVAAMESSNSMWGMLDPDGSNDVWIRTTSRGIRPFTNGTGDNANSSLGASDAYFATAYIKTIYGFLSGTADKANKAAATVTQYGVAYYSNSDGTFGSTNAGSATQALLGNSSGAPTFTSINTTLSHTAGNGSNANKLNVTVLGIAATEIEISKASTTAYGETILSTTLSSTDESSAATPKGVLAAIAGNSQLNVSSNQYGIAYFTDAAGTIDSTATPGANTALVGKTNAAPGFVSISPELTLTAGDGNNSPKLAVKVLGVTSDPVTITTASTSAYGTTKLSSSAGTTSGNTFTRNNVNTLAATPGMVWAAIDTLDVSEPTASGNSITFIAELKQVDGKIVTKKMTVRSASVDYSGVVDTGDQSFAGKKTFTGETVFSNNTTTTGVATFNGNVLLNSSTQADSLQAGSLVVSGNTSLVNNTTTSTILPSSNNAYNIGASGNKYATIYATNFDGTASKATAAAITTSANAIAYYTDGNGTFGSITSGSGALYATGTGAQPTFGTLPAQQGGTGQSEYAKYDILYASTTTALSRLAAGNAGQLLQTGNGNTAPKWVSPSTLSVAKAAGMTGSNLTQYGVVYIGETTNNSFSVTNAGSGTQALVGSSTGGPSFADISPSISQTTNTTSKQLELTISVLNTTSDALTLTNASTTVYGTTKLCNAHYSANTTRENSSALAATPGFVWGAIDTLTATDPTASGSSITFIAEITQANGIISPKKMTVRSADENNSGVVSTTDQIFAGDKSFLGATTFNNNTTTTGVATFNGNVNMNSSVTADSLQAGSLIVSGNTSLVNTTTTSTILPKGASINIGASGNKYGTIYAETFDGVAEKAKKSNNGSTLNAIAYYSDTSGTFNYISAGKGALYASGATQKASFGTLPADMGGTGIDQYTQYDILYASATNTLSVLNASTDGYVLITHGSTKAPEWVNPTSIGVDAAARTSNTITQYGVAYYSSSTGTFASTAAGSATTALIGTSDGGPTFASISPSITQQAVATSSASEKIQITVLGVTSDPLGFTLASTSVYGVTKLTNSTTSTSKALAITPNGVHAILNAMDVSDPSADGHALTFIDTISQTDGVISATKKTVQSASDTQAGVVDLYDQTFAGDKSFLGAVAISNNLTVSGETTINGNVHLNSSTDADSLQAGSLLVSGNTSLVNTTTTSTILPKQNDAINIGASGNKYHEIYASTFKGNVTGNLTGDLYGDIRNAKTTVYGDLVPNSNDAHSLGIAEDTSNNVLAQRWIVNASSIDATSIYVSGASNFDGAVIVYGTTTCWNDLTVTNGHQLKANNAVDSTSNTTGAILSAGGIYAGKKSYFADALLIANATAASTTKESSQLKVANTAGTDVAIELYRGALSNNKNSKRSWQIINSSGTLSFRTDYNTSGTQQTTYSNTIVSFSGTDAQVTFYGHLVPSATNTKTLGTSSIKWATVYARDIEAAGYVTIGSTLDVTGAATFSSTVAVTGATTLNNDLTVTGLTNFNGNVLMNSSAHADSFEAGSLLVTGNTSLTNTTTTSTLLPSSNAAYNIGAVGNTYLNVYASKFYGALEGNVTGNITGNAGSADQVKAKLSTAEKIYLLGTTNTLTSTAANAEMKGDSGVYVTQTVGEISAVRHSWNTSGTEKAYSYWNSSTESIDFMFV